MCTLKCHFALVDKLHCLQSTFLSFSRMVLMCFLRSSHLGHIKSLLVHSDILSLLWTVVLWVLRLSFCGVMYLQSIHLELSFYT